MTSPFCGLILTYSGQEYVSIKTKMIRGDRVNKNSYYKNNIRNFYKLFWLIFSGFIVGFGMVSIIYASISQAFGGSLSEKQEDMLWNLYIFWQFRLGFVFAVLFLLLHLIKERNKTSTKKI